MSLPIGWYLTLAAVLFGIGAFGLLTRRSALIMFMCIELMLNAVNLTFVTFSRAFSDIGGQAAVFFVMVVAAAEVTVGLGIVVSVFRRNLDHTLPVGGLLGNSGLRFVADEECRGMDGDVCRGRLIHRERHHLLVVAAPERP